MPLLFEYTLPQERIAQRQAPGRASCLLHARQEPGGRLCIRDRQFGELPGLLREGDLLVLNDSRVAACRFFVGLAGREQEAELLLLGREPEEQAPGGESEETGSRERWRALARPMRRFRDGEVVELSSNLLLRVLGRTLEGGALIVELSASCGRPIAELIEESGSMPIPPYIRGGRADRRDREEYQTAYAAVTGSAAAPTAGLHFTEEVFEKLDSRGIRRCTITHHVGPASFLPVRDGDWRSHRMSAERYTLCEDAIVAIERVRREGGRIAAVGTTCVRALESAWAAGAPRPGEQSTELYITPGFRFRIVDVLLTNFHQPQSTHLLLVAAFFGVEAVREIYHHALAGAYRFLSYGDAMLLELGRRADAAQGPEL